LATGASNSLDTAPATRYSRSLVNDIADWLKSIGLEKYTSLFVDNEITPDVLPHLTEADIDRLGLPIGSRRRLAVAVEALLAGASAAPPPVGAVSSRVGLSGGAERRQLTVMFADMVGSSALAERLDPEELRELMQAYRRACSDVTARYDGHVAQYLGDGLMVYFGWPRAHEDDAERGVRAALDMVEAVQSLPTAHGLAIRVGLATGPVVVGDAAGDQDTEAKLAIGETPNLAARLQTLAGPGEVLISNSTRRLVGDSFVLADLGTPPIKGFAGPVQLWRVDAVRRASGRFEAAHAGKALTPLVGRDEEIALLLRRWDQVLEGEGQVVLVGGEAGIGKSRLTQALLERIDEPHTLLRYQCSPFNLNSALHPFIETFEVGAGFSRDDTAEQKLDRMEAALVGDEIALREARPLMAAMLSLPTHRYPPVNLSPQKQKERTLEVMAGQIEAQARRGPVLMLFEDAHWIDPTSQELLDLLVLRLHRMPVLLAATHRPEHAPAWAGQSGVTTLTLNRLAQRQVARLVEEVTAGMALPPELLSEILSRTDGVPLFVEELTKAVLESGLVRQTGEFYAVKDPSALFIPTSLRDSLVARFDRLASVKEIAQVGACIGREFSYELVARVASLGGEQLETALNKLVDTGLATRRGAPPDATYTFKHALVQDAAYDSLLKSRRSQLHARIAQVLETEFGDQVSSAPHLLAHHHTAAGNVAAAIPLWRRAGEQSLRRVALKEAIGHFQKGLGLIDQLQPSPERDRLELTIREPLNAAWTGLRGWAAADVAANAEAILRLAKSQQNAQSLLLGLWWMWTSVITQGRIADSIRWAQRMLDEGREADDIDLLIFGHAASMVSALLNGRPVESQEQAKRVFELYDSGRAQRWLQLTGYDVRTFVEVYACQMTWMLGYPDRARQACEQSTAHARTVGHAFNLVWALAFSAYVYAYRREPARLLDQVREAERLARDQGIAFISEVSVPQSAGIAHLKSGRHQEAIVLLRKGIERWTNVGGHVRIPYVKSALAQAVAIEGDLDGALQLIDECLEQIERPAWQEREWLPEVLRVKGSILARLGRHDDAESLLGRSIECARAQQARSWELRASTTLASLLSERGRRDEARALLAPIYGWFTEGFETPDLVDARILLEKLSGKP
jgi:class 3 adenylate cyclase